MVRVFLFISICFSVLFLIKEPEDDDTDDDDDVVILLYRLLMPPIRLCSWFNLAFPFLFSVSLSSKHGFTVMLTAPVFL